MSQLERLPFPVRLLLAGNLGLAALHAANGIAGAPFRKINRLVNMNEEGNIPAWFSSVQWMSVAGLFGFVAWQSRRKGDRSWSVSTLLAVLFALLSMDEVAQVHERLSIGLSDKLMGGQGPYGAMWLVALGLPVAFVLWRGALRLRAAFDAAPGSLRLYLAGLALFTFGALLLEPALQLLGLRDIPWWLVMLEETLELVGVTTLVWSGLTLARSLGLMAFETTDRIAPQRAEGS